MFNNYFSSVFTPQEDLQSNNATTTDINDTISSGSPTQSIDQLSVMESDVLRTLKSFDPDKALGSDEIPGRILKVTANQITLSLTRLFNKSLQVGVVPDEWKLANVVPVFKKGEMDRVENNRPIALLCIVSKLLERCILNHLRFSLQNIINRCQHGFTSAKSCTTQLIQVIDTIGKLLDQGEQIDVVYLDMSKAFDKVNHTKMIDKLRSFGFNGGLLTWFQSYLRHRRQKVTALGSTSMSTLVTSEVPQESILGTILFLLYVNDLPDAISSSTIATFADDTKLNLRDLQDCRVMRLVLPSKSNDTENQSTADLTTRTWNTLQKEITQNHNKSSLATFKNILKEYYYSTLSLTFDPDDPRTWKTTCVKCNCARSLLVPPSCCF
ncbi:Hypothetical predicted protein [Paramuricea clavata]|uniref:Uncharacterized protein n=1 Tax=Paramuricea clavata TaxID=317549 RepID=A0A6S7JTY3_PARCT|nr:Hypothetical predicted protein [Paramuricea clavata]